MFSTLQDMLREGKNENMLRNAYIKYMCWLYYKFERIVNRLGAEQLPQILYDGAVSQYELQLLTVLSRAGADIVLLERGGDSPYLKLDPSSALSVLYQEPGMTAFPDGFGLKGLQEELRREENRQRLYGPPPLPPPLHQRLDEEPPGQELLTSAQGRGASRAFSTTALSSNTRSSGQAALPPTICSPSTSS